MTHANGCHISISPDIYSSSQTPPPNPSASDDGGTRGQQSLQRWGVWLKCCPRPSVISLPLVLFSQLIKVQLYYQVEPFTQAFVLCWFQLGHYGVLVGRGGSASSRYKITAVTWRRPWLSTVLLPSESSVHIQYWQEEEKRAGGGGGGSTLSHFTHPSIHDPLPSPQAGDRLWGCGRADYRPCPSGSGCHSSSFFYLQDLRWRWRWGGGNAWEAGLICAKQGPKHD